MARSRLRPGSGPVRHAAGFAPAAPRG